MSTAAYMTVPEVEEKPFYEAILINIGAPVTPNTLMAFYAWRQAESGKATYNPFNTTKQIEGSSRYGTNTAGKGGVQNYLTPADGLHATLLTLQNGLYDDMLDILRRDGTPEEFADAVGASRWGTGTLVREVVDMYRRGKFETKPIYTVPGAPPISSLTAPATVSEIFKTETGEFNWWWLVAGAALVGGGVAIYYYTREN